MPKVSTDSSTDDVDNEHMTDSMVDKSDVVPPALSDDNCESIAACASAEANISMPLVPTDIEHKTATNDVDKWCRLLPCRE